MPQDSLSEFRDVHRVDKKLSEPIDPPDDNGVAKLSLIEEFLRPGALDRGPASGGDVGENFPLLHVRFDQSVYLERRVLPSGADPRVPKMPHPAILPHKPLEGRAERQNATRQVYETRRSPDFRHFDAALRVGFRCLGKL